jgi:7-cyano-7-deazaguanine synthase in queuosine biosynthesis
VPSGSDPLVLALQGAKPNVFLQISDLSEAMARNVPDILTDLLDVAAYVFAADQGTSRGGPRDTGEKWRRRFRFHVPVRSPETWSRAPVMEALTDVLSFLSEDTFEFVFTKLEQPPPVQLYFDHLGADFRVDEVMLFSGGLDSLAGAIQEAIIDGRSVALVSHDSASKRKPKVEALAKDVAQRAGAATVRHIPVWATKAEEVGGEYTQRTRSFLYAALATAVSAMMGKDRIRFYENGVTSMNLPIAPQVVGSRATRTTHPQSIRGFGRFFSALLDRPFVVESPFVWKTKTDVVRLIKDSGHGVLAAHTVSCSRTFEATKLHPHCGRCSLCIDRRFATLAAGLSDEEDPPEMYKADLLTGERPMGETRTMAESFLQRASKLRTVHELDLFAEYPEATRSIRHVGLESEEAARRIVELHRRHGEDVQAALAEGHKRHARAFQEGTLPDSCLLVLAVPGRYRQKAGDGVATVPTFRLEGDFWKVYFENETASLKNSVGMRHIARLLASPKREWHCADLLAQEAGHSGPTPVGSGGEATDKLSIRSFRARLQQLADDLTEAKIENDVHRQAEIREEARKIEAHLKSTTGLGDEPRPAADDNEKARQTVTTAIRRAVKSMDKKHRYLGQHLRKCLKTGVFCCYSPDPEVTWVTQ